jgi:hypothetical protein
MKTILEVAEQLGLDDRAFKELVCEGKLFGIKLDESCLQKARQAILDAARRKPTKH